jgi:indole-3-glycerol phosphate synthase
MHNKLKMILEKKAETVAALKQSMSADHPVMQLLNNPQVVKTNKSFHTQLSQPGLNVIAEIKRRSPSKGDLAEINNPVELANTYEQAGASAISVLTDEFFSGSIDDLKAVTESLQSSNCCVLRKDFVIDPIQIAEAVVAGANAVLLIATVLKEKTTEFLRFCEQLGIDALVEVHNEEDLQYALAAKAKIIGVNNRDLTDFTVDTTRSLRLKQLIPNDVITVAESGIFDGELAQHYQANGFNAVLVGEALVKADDPAQLIKAMRGMQ